MECAPILIPTLNRTDHLKRCISSLSKNKLACETELFISVDYPPHEKYIDGYKNVVQYLSKGIKGFKKVNIIIQEKNLGPSKNASFLKKLASEKYDRYIFTEDDIEFSSNFLEYINKGLEKFNDDYNVMGICGFKDTEWLNDKNNIILSKLFPGYGFGSWFNREIFLKEDIPKVLLSKKTINLTKMIIFLFRNPTLFHMYISDILLKKEGLFWNSDGTLNICDTTRSIYLHLTEKTCVVPNQTKSRNWGSDGSGVNMPKITGIDPIKKWELDTDSDFNFIMNNTLEFNTKNYSIGAKYLSNNRGKKKIFISIIEYLILLTCYKNRELVMDIISFMKGLIRK